MFPFFLFGFKVKEDFCLVYDGECDTKIKSWLFIACSSEKEFSFSHIDTHTTKGGNLILINKENKDKTVQRN